MNFKDLWITLLILHAIEEKQFMLWISSGHELHWLPVWIPADYKIIRLFFHFLYYIASAYLSELIMPYYLRWSLYVTFLFVPCIRQKKFGRHFPFSSSTIWNFSPFFLKHCLHLRLSCLASKFTFLRNIFHKQANSNALWFFIFSHTFHLCMPWCHPFTAAYVSLLYVDHQLNCSLLYIMHLAQLHMLYNFNYNYY